MNVDEFRGSLANEHPPAYASTLLTALWWDGKNNWERAHGMVDHLETTEAMAVHAYLHRKEGDSSNALYWYRRAGRPFCNDSLEEEWTTLVDELLPKAA